MSTSTPPFSVSADLLRRAFAVLPPPVSAPPSGRAAPVTPDRDLPPVAEHRREWLFGLSASALATAPDDSAEDLKGLIRERVDAALALTPSIHPRHLFGWVRGELFADFPLSPAEGHRFALTVAQVLLDGELVGVSNPDTGKGVIRRPADPAPVGTTAKVSGADTVPLNRTPTLAERVDALADLPDPRVAEWVLLSTACGLTPDDLADYYDIAPTELARDLNAVLSE